MKEGYGAEDAEKQVNTFKSKRTVFFIEPHLQFDLVPNKKRVWEWNELNIASVTALKNTS